MPLDEYKRKRDFTTSPEPAGEPRRTSRPGKDLLFCVQKHLASHLHYDLRLEHDGVLLSWAVPKGPSLDPSVKRLAMQVEDHPVEYGAFEGVIPEGYGAGIVMLWDTGTWTPEVPDVAAALAKGDLKIKLDGYKLKGSWALVRTRGYGGSRDGRSWLLIKHRDDWAGDVDITTFAPLSVKSGHDFHEILAADNPAIWHSNRPASGGETGKMLRSIIDRAVALKAGAADPEAAAPAAASKTTRPESTRRRTGKAASPAAGAGRRRSTKPAGTRSSRKPRTSR